MTSDAPLTYVGFGFGAIQAGLLLFEAFRSGAYDRLVVAEVVPETIESLRRAKGAYTINIAHADRIEQAGVRTIEPLNPEVETDRERLIDAIASAESVGTAIPSIDHYASPSPGSLHRVLAEGLLRKSARDGPRMVVYTAENHNRAAEILENLVRSALPDDRREAALSRVRFLNTVIGKMSGLVPDQSSPEARALAPFVPGSRRAFLVEAFNRILISRIQFPDEAGSPPFRRGITVFEEKEDLLPFEEAKLYGHNAAHALGAYLGARLGVSRMASLRGIPGLMAFLRAAFLKESGDALIRKHAGVDPLFSPAGFASYADDLLERMTNPHLMDTVERVARDAVRKLAWEDRLVGTMRLALQMGITPKRYAIGAAAATAIADRGRFDAGDSLAPLLFPLWAPSAPDPGEQERVLSLVEEGRRQLRRWQSAGYPPLEDFINAG